MARKTIYIRFLNRSHRERLFQNQEQVKRSMTVGICLALVFRSTAGRNLQASNRISHFVGKRSVYDLVKRSTNVYVSNVQLYV